MKTTRILPAAALLASTLIFGSCNTLVSKLPKPDDFGTNRDNQAVRVWTLENANGLRARVTDHGATLVSFHAPDRDGAFADVVLGFDSVTGYQSSDNQYFGCTTGRIANRIGGASFVLDGRRYELAANDGDSQLHGGVERSLDKVLWKLVGQGKDRRGHWVEFRYDSPAGEEGYPGNVTFYVRYALRDDDALEITSRAQCDRRTPISLTNHAYWNLDGAGSATILDHHLRIPALSYTPTDDEMIPTGDIASVAGTPLDFREMTRIGARIAELTSTAARGYDHNYCILDGGRDLLEVARLYSPASGRELVVESNEPGLQFYTGNYLKRQLGKDGQYYALRSGLCLEPQKYPNAVNREAFPSVICDPDEEYKQVIVYRVGVRK